MIFHSNHINHRTLKSRKSLGLWCICKYCSLDWTKWYIFVGSTCYHKNNTSLTFGEKTETKSEEKKEYSCTCFSKMPFFFFLFFFYKYWLVETRETNAIWPSHHCLKCIISCLFGFSFVVFNPSEWAYWSCLHQWGCFLLLPNSILCNKYYSVVNISHYTLTGHYNVHIYVSGWSN